MDFIRLDPSDTVVTATRALEVGAEVEGVATRALIPSGHKIATVAMPAGTPVRKYAQVIGYSAEDIAAGDHVHTHNVEFRGTDVDYDFATNLRPVAPASGDTFMGFRR